jgi:hypothetical protein
MFFSDLLSSQVVRTLIFRSMYTFRGLDTLTPEQQMQLMAYAKLVPPMIEGKPYTSKVPREYQTTCFCLTCGHSGTCEIGTRNPLIFGCASCQWIPTPGIPYYRPFISYTRQWSSEDQKECIEVLTKLTTNLTIN